MWGGIILLKMLISHKKIVDILICGQTQEIHTIYLLKLRENIMSAIRDQEHFIERTREILDENFDNFQDKDREVTFLLNCLLGLIVAIAEQEKPKPDIFKNKIDNDFLKFLPDKIGFLKKAKNEYDLTSSKTRQVSFEICHKEDLKKKEKQWLLKMVRNGIAHLNIEWENDNGKCKNIRLWNEPRSGVMDFEIVFTIEELRNFAVELSNKYLIVKQKKTGN